MTKERAITLIKSNYPQNPRKPWGVEYKNACEMAIKALEQEPCDNAISRQAAIRLAEQGQVQGFEWQFKELVKLSPVTPVKKTGEWVKKTLVYDVLTEEYIPVIYTEDDRKFGNTPVYECNKCKSISKKNTNYCPNCGAKMWEEGE